MDRVEARLKILELARPQVSVPSIDLWMERAASLEAYVLGAGHADEAPAETKTKKASRRSSPETALSAPGIL